MTTRFGAQPRSLLAQLNLYEGLALACDELSAKEPVPGSKEHEIVRTFSQTYLEIVGVEPSSRRELRESLEKQIADVKSASSEGSASQIH